MGSPEAYHNGDFRQPCLSVSGCQCASAHTGVHEVQDTKMRENQMAAGPAARMKRAECQTLSPLTSKSNLPALLLDNAIQ